MLTVSLLILKDKKGGCWYAVALFNIFKKNYSLKALIPKSTARVLFPTFAAVVIFMSRSSVKAVGTVNVY